MALQLKVTLAGSSKPPIWRRILIQEKATFQDLHLAIQSSFDWRNCHLWEFSNKSFRDPRIGIPSDDDWDEGPQYDARKTRLSNVFKRKGGKFTYLYDFGDSWEHTILVEGILPEPVGKIPQCIAGKGACPPEDCGGIWGYYEMVEAINDPKHESHQGMMEWMGLEKGDTWDVKHFDLAKPTRRLKASFK